MGFGQTWPGCGKIIRRGWPKRGVASALPCARLLIPNDGILGGVRVNLIRVPCLLTAGVGGLLLLAGCQRGAEEGLYQGYLEAEFVYVAAPVGGTLQSLAVERGQPITAGAVLFELDPEPERSGVLEASNRVAQAEARLGDLRKGLRPSEIDALQARLEQAQAAAKLGAIELKRGEELYRTAVISIDDLDRLRATHDQQQALVDELAAELVTARLGAREDAVQAAEADVAASRAALSSAQWRLTQKRQTAPAAALVHDTLYRPGEWVGPGSPVVVLFPPGNLKVRFFVPQSALAEVRPGRMVRVSFDGTPQPFPAGISYVSTEAEFTPPVIYSQETRAKLVYLVEARFTTEARGMLRPGQPVDVRLEPALP